MCEFDGGARTRVALTCRCYADPGLLASDAGRTVSFAIGESAVSSIFVRLRRFWEAAA
ncbi:hypothetical protein CBM2585_A10091 [Cupriavidus taiwanensis]|nr:hypothetical protein CBM2585_A10091 [Cupriavidus taiwanensis]